MSWFANLYCCFQVPGVFPLCSKWTTKHGHSLQSLFRPLPLLPFALLTCLPATFVFMRYASPDSFFICCPSHPMAFLPLLLHSAPLPCHSNSRVMCISRLAFQRTSFFPFSPLAFKKNPLLPFISLLLLPLNCSGISPWPQVKCLSLGLASTRTFLA